MKVAVVGSRSGTIDDLGKYLPDDVEEIVSGGARGIDTCVKSRGTKYVLDICKKMNKPVTVYFIHTPVK